MHTQPLILAILLLGTSIFAQCNIDAGNDTTNCPAHIDSLQLGGNPTFIGGIPPYIYTWETTYQIGSQIYTASYFLDDTTAANPMFNNIGIDSIAFHLTVTDSVGNICRDTMSIRTCFFYVVLGEEMHYINQGDSVIIHSNPGSGTCSPFTFHWTPNYNISDTTAMTPLVWPDNTTVYSVMVTNAEGCQIQGATVLVGVIPLSNKQAKKDMLSIDIFPQPLREAATLKINSEGPFNYTIEFYDLLGRPIKTISLQQEQTMLYRSDFEAGIYFYRILEKGKMLGMGQLLVE